MSEVIERLERLSIPEPNSGCVIWTGSLDGHGYGQISVSGRPRKAHRVAYELAKGPVPEGLELDHKCRVRCCINPDHLEPVTRRENLRRGIGPALSSGQRKFVCGCGDAMEVVGRARYGPQRACRRCRAARQKLWWAKNGARYR